MNGNHYDVAIIGGGVVGASIAFQLAKRQFRVIVLEKERVAGQASSAAGGMLGAQSEFSNESPLLPLALKSRAMFPSIAEELKEMTGIDIGLVQKGMLKVAVTDEEREALQRHYEFWKKFDGSARWLTIHEATEMEPNVSCDLKGVMYLPNDGQVSASDLSVAFAKASIVYGAEWREYTEVVNFLKEGKTYLLYTNHGTMAADAIVIAAGAWSAQILERTGISIPMYPVKGECLFVKTERPLVQATVFAKNGCYIVPKKENKLLIGATSTPNTFDKKVSVQGIKRLLEQAQQLIPSIRHAEWEKAWTGIRPQTGDGLPYIGVHPEYERVWIATGHYRNGILLSPITGVLVADLIEGKGSGEIDLAPFSVTRNSHVTHL
ncbi:glycine oxidase ThiO [Thermaerobacillus caldiproteolyticus]|uniref:glycine oxidase n=1 Tax=Thermaerobacillus caldiproteolyticus TaxID=247480 RepID=A0A7V9Z643_9BACL|nr:glycine oxidase ThiO [Anoxybacillus caldiproteolyticus]MBA2874767.1 glycine oxidase [Anoxybacillus caldiproteolyticus]